MLISYSSISQTESGHLSFYTYAQSLQFQRQYYTSPANYLQYATIVNENGTLYSLIVDNYELYCFTNLTGTDSWTKEKITTNHDGDIYMAFIGLTGNNQRVIAYSYNSYFNYGAATPYGKEFWCTTIIMVETPGGWEEKIYYTPAADSWSNNYALVPYAINTSTDGKVHVILQRRGWYTYGGELHEVIVDYSNNQVNWGTLALIHKYNEGTVDRGTSWIGRYFIASDKEHLIYYKQSPTLGTYYIDYAIKENGVWQTPSRLRTTAKGNYHYIDLDADNQGNFYFMYIENNEPSGPTLWLNKNEINFNHSFTPFASGDVATKANLFPLDDGSVNVLVFLQDQHPKIFNFENGILTELDPLTFDDVEASDLFIGKTFTPIPNFAMLNSEIKVLAFSSDNVTTTTSGDITTYLPYSRLFVEVDWQLATSSETKVYFENTISLFPTPVVSRLYISNISERDLIRIYAINGRLVKTQNYNSNGINLNDLPGGMYILEVNNSYHKFLKK